MSKGRRRLSEAAHSKMNQQDVGDSLDGGGGEEEETCHLPKSHQAGIKTTALILWALSWEEKKKLVVNLMARNNLTLR